MRVLIGSAAILACFFLGLYGGPHAKRIHASLFPPEVWAMGDYSALYSRAGKQVVIFTTSTCPYCAKLRDHLERQQVDYRDYVIDGSEQAAALYRSVSEEGGGVPLSFIGNRRVMGYNEKIIDQSLAARQRQD